MDTITHGIVGALTGKALFAGRDMPAGSVGGMVVAARSSDTARAAIVACTLGSMFPDIDIFAGPLAHNPLAIMEWHRNVTHSIALLPVWALLLAAVSLPLARWLRWERPPFLLLAGIYAAGLATHVFLDVVTNFGTMVWSPLQYSRVAWDWLFILDLTLTAFALVPQFASWCYRAPAKFALRAGCTWAALTTGAFGAYLLATTSGTPFPIWIVGILSVILGIVIFVPRIGGAGFRWRRASWCRAGLTLVCIYVASAAAMHRTALADVNRVAGQNHLSAEHLAALPLPPTLTHWAGVIQMPGGVWRATFHLPGGAIESERLYESADSDPHVEAAKKLRDVQVYLWFARFPIWRVQPRDTQTVVEIYDVRFIRVDDPELSTALGHSENIDQAPVSRTGFAFEVVFDADGNVISHGVKKPE